MNASSIARSGMQAASLRLDSAAHNIANADTAQFRRQLVLQKTQGTGGVSAHTSQANTAGSALETDMVDQMSASYSFKANLRTIQTQDSMLGSLLNAHA